MPPARRGLAFGAIKAGPQRHRLPFTLLREDVMDKKRVIGWLIPALYGFAVGTLVAWIAQNVGPGRDAVFELFGIMALLIATYLKLRTGYNWPWEGQTEWAKPQTIPAKTYLRN